MKRGIQKRDIYVLLSFDHRCFQIVVHKCWDYRVSNSEAGFRVLDKNGKSLDELAKCENDSCKSILQGIKW